MKKLFLSVLLLTVSFVATAQVVATPPNDDAYRVQITIEVLGTTGEAISKVIYFSPGLDRYVALTSMSADISVLAAAWTKLLHEQNAPKAMGLRAAGGSAVMNIPSLGQ